MQEADRGAPVLSGLSYHGSFSRHASGGLAQIDIVEARGCDSDHTRREFTATVKLSIRPGAVFGGVA